MMGAIKKMQPTLLHVPIPNDIEFTPRELVVDMLNWFSPVGYCLDPCRGNGAFFDLLQAPKDWCEIEEGKDFYQYYKKVDWVIGNPPYSHYAFWMRHSMEIADNILYIMPVYKVFASAKFLDDLLTWGGIRHIRRYGTGTDWGFPFGHALSAVHYQRDYHGPTEWSKYGK